MLVSASDCSFPYDFPADCAPGIRTFILKLSLYSCILNHHPLVIHLQLRSASNQTHGKNKGLLSKSTIYPMMARAPCNILDAPRPATARPRMKAWGLGAAAQRVEPAVEHQLMRISIDRTQGER